MRTLILLIGLFLFYVLAVRRGDPIYAETDLVIVGCGVEHSLQFGCFEDVRLFQSMSSINDSATIKLKGAGFQVEGKKKYMSQRNLRSNSI